MTPPTLAFVYFQNTNAIRATIFEDSTVRLKSGQRAKFDGIGNIYDMSGALLFSIESEI